MFNNNIVIHLFIDINILLINHDYKPWLTINIDVY